MQIVVVINTYAYPFFAFPIPFADLTNVEHENVSLELFSVVRIFSRLSLVTPDDSTESFTKN